MNRFTQFVKAHKIITVIAGLVVVGGGAYAFGGNNKAPAEFSTAPVEKITLVQSIEETGSVTADVDITYGFEVSGRVIRVSKAVGDVVKTGDVIAEIDNTLQLQSLRQAQAAYARASASLNVRLEGASAEQIKESQIAIERAKAALAQATADNARVKSLADTKVLTAEKSLSTAENNLKLVQETGTSQILTDAYADAVNALKSVLTTLRTNLKDADNILGIDNKLANDDIEDIIGNRNQQAIYTAENMYTVASALVRQVEQSISNITNQNPVAIATSISVTDNAVDDVRQLLLDVEALLNATSPTGDVTQAELETLKSGIIVSQGKLNTANSELTAASQNIEAAKTSLSSAKIAFDQATIALADAKRQKEIEYQLADATLRIQTVAEEQAEAAHATLIAPPRTVDVAALRADVLRESASVTSAQKEFDKTKLTALSDGVIAKLDIKTGENAQAGSGILSILSPKQKIELDISESDIAKVHTGNETKITFDAFGDDVEFTGKVLAIDPAQTEISGVVYYKTDILFDPKTDYDIRPGMTANVRVITETKSDTLVIPSRAVIDKDGKKIVRVVTDKTVGTFVEREVSVGLRGDEGKIEVLSGLTVGEEVVTFLKEE